MDKNSSIYILITFQTHTNRSCYISLRNTASLVLCPKSPFIISEFHLDTFPGDSLERTPCLSDRTLKSGIKSVVQTLELSCFICPAFEGGLSSLPTSQELLPIPGRSSLLKNNFILVTFDSQSHATKPPAAEFTPGQQMYPASF